MTQTEQTTSARPSWRRSPKLWWPIGIAVALALVIAFYFVQAGTPAPIQYGAFLDQLDQGNIASVTFKGNALDGIFKRAIPVSSAAGAAAQEVFRTYVPDVGDPTLIPALRNQRVAIDVSVPSGWDWLLGHVPFPILIFAGVLIAGWVVRLIRGGKQGGPDSVRPMHQMGGPMGMISGLFGKQRDDGPRPPRTEKG